MQEITGNIRIPKKNEVLGIVESMLGTNKLSVKCQDKLTRICRIPGKMRKRIWIHEGDAVIVKPWPIQGDERGDIIFIYKHNQITWLRKKAILTLK